MALSVKSPSQRAIAIILGEDDPVSTVKKEVESLLARLPDDCSLEDIQYHLYVIDKVQRGLDAADDRASVSQEEVEQRLGRWLTE